MGFDYSGFVKAQQYDPMDENIVEGLNLSYRQFSHMLGGSISGAFTGLPIGIRGGSGGPFKPPKKVDKLPARLRLPAHLRSDRPPPRSVQPKVPAYAKLPGELGRPVNTVEGLVPSRGKGLQGHFLANETVKAKRARLAKLGTSEKLERTGFYTQAPERKFYEGKQGGGFGELRELDVEGYDEFVRNQKFQPKGDQNMSLPEQPASAGAITDHVLKLTDDVLEAMPSTFKEGFDLLPQQAWQESGIRNIALDPDRFSGDSSTPWGSSNIAGQYEGETLFVNPEANQWKGPAWTASGLAHEQAHGFFKTLDTPQMKFAELLQAELQQWHINRGSTELESFQALYKEGSLPTELISEKVRLGTERLAQKGAISHDDYRNILKEAVNETLVEIKKKHPDTYNKAKASFGGTTKEGLKFGDLHEQTVRRAMKHDYQRSKVLYGK